MRLKLLLASGLFFGLLYWLRTRRRPMLPRDLAHAVTNQGSTLADLSRSGPLLIVFLRHFGCTFCREAVADLARLRDELGARLALVHLNHEQEAAATLGAAGLGDVPRFSDPEASLYQHFKLGRFRMSKAMLGRVWEARHHGVGWPTADWRQLGGALLVENGRVVSAWRAQHAGDRPDYRALCPGRGWPSVTGSA